MTESAEQGQHTHQPQKAQRSHYGYMLGIIIIIVLGLAGAGYYLFSQLRARQEHLGGEVKVELHKEVADYQKQLTAIQTQLAALETAIVGKDTHFTKTLADHSALHNDRLAMLRKELTEKISHLERQLGKTRGDWLIADAQYLLVAANERLALVGDVDTARLALEAADQRLRESGDAAVFKVREQIAKELAALAATAVPDIVGFYAKLDSLEDKVGELELILPHPGTPAALAAQADPAHDDGQVEEPPGLMRGLMDRLAGVVVVRHGEQPIDRILTLKETQFIREQLRAKLDIAKLALVQRHDALFQSALNDASQWFDEHFSKDAVGELFTRQLGQLRAARLEGHLPDIGQSLKMLNDLAKLRIEADQAAEARPTPPAPAMPPASPAPPPSPGVPDAGGQASE